MPCEICQSRTTDTTFLGTEFCREHYEVYFSQCGGCGCEFPNPATTDTFPNHCSECISQPAPSSDSRGCESCGDSLESSLLSRLPDLRRVCGPCLDRLTAPCVDCSQLILISEIDATHEYPICSNCAGRSEWHNRGFYSANPGYDEIASTRKFGIEIETSNCEGYQEIRTSTPFGAVIDGSCDGMEFVSPVLYGDVGLGKVRELCEHARRLNWEIDSACGLHIHLDLSDESDINCFKLAHAYGYTYDFWTSFITNSRKRNYYCARHTYNSNSLAGRADSGRGFDRWVCNNANERYTWVNWGAYNKFKTVEIRHHAASLNPTKLTNWVKAHCRFIDSVMDTPLSEIIRSLNGRSVYDQLNTIKGWWNDDELTAHYKDRAALFGKPIINSSVLAASS